MTKRTLEWLQKKIRNYTDQDDKKTAYQFLDNYKDIEGVDYDLLHLQILTSKKKEEKETKPKRKTKTKTKEYKTSKATTTIRTRR